MSRKNTAPTTPSQPPARTSWFSRIATIIGVLAGLFAILIGIIFVIGFIALITGPQLDTIENGNVAIIPLTGIIVSSSDNALFATDTIVSHKIVKRLEKLGEDNSIEAIILEINSPGGSPVASDDIGTAIKKLDKPVIAVIKDIGASGGYWIASSTDYVIANRMSLTGSIGVMGSSFGFEGLLDDYNITYRQLIAGDMKDAGTPYREMTTLERDRMQSLLDTIHEEFIAEVATNRNLSLDHVRQVADGFVLLGSQAKSVGLVDKLGDINTAQEHVESLLGKNVTLARYLEQPGLLELLSGVSTNHFYSMGRGIGDSVVEDDTDFSVMLR